MDSNASHNLSKSISEGTRDACTRRGSVAPLSHRVVWLCRVQELVCVYVCGGSGWSGVGWVGMVNGSVMPDIYKNVCCFVFSPWMSWLALLATLTSHVVHTEYFLVYITMLSITTLQRPFPVVSSASRPYQFSPFVAHLPKLAHRTADILTAGAKREM